MEATLLKVSKIRRRNFLDSSLQSFSVCLWKHDTCTCIIFCSGFPYRITSFSTYHWEILTWSVEDKSVVSLTWKIKNVHFPFCLQPLPVLSLFLLCLECHKSYSDCRGETLSGRATVCAWL